MASFSIKRTASATKWLILNNQRNLLRVTAGTFFLFFFVVLGYAGTTLRDVSYELVALEVHEAAFLGLGITGLFLFLSGASVVADMKDTQPRISAMMLPASNAEKFVSRIVYITVVQAAACLVAAVAADLLQMLFHIVHGNSPISMFSIVGDLSAVFHWSTTDFLIASAVALLAIWGHSVYVLGGTFFRRNQWILTTVAWCLASTVLSWLGMLIPFGSITGDYGGESLITSLGLEDYVIDTYGVFLTIDVTLLLLIALNYWLSFRLFCRMQVICNKWINL